MQRTSSTPRSAPATAPKLRLAALGAALLTAAGLVNAAPALAATTTLAPASITTSAGSIGSGQTVANLAVRDQSGTQDTWNKYVEFIGAYDGYRSYALPGSVNPADVTAVEVSVNYRGPATAQQTWTWSLYNWTTSSWTSVGTNATAPAWGSWKLLSFPSPSGAAAYVSGTGAIRVQLKANNATDAADIDYESVLVTSSAGTADTTPPSTPTGLAVSGTPTTSSVALTWAASTDNVGVTGYEVFQNGGATPVATPAGTSATIGGLAAGTSYSFTVKARDAAGNRSAASAAVSATTATSGGGTGYTLPPANGKFSYQLGGSYTPESGVQVVSRDRTSAPAGAGYYNICYVNLLQTQPDEAGQSTTNPPYGTTQWWKNNHPGLLLKDSSGKVIVDADWNEALFDVRTAANRSALLAIQGGWFQGCKDAGYQAVEPDNLDAFARSKNLITFAQTRAYLELVVPYVHGIGLAIAQKNASDSPGGYGGIGATFVGGTEGFDFAIAEECAAYTECGNYTSVYGALVYEIEYTDNNPNQTRSGVTKKAYAWICQDDGATRSIILRDRNVVPAGTSGYFYQEC